jgi:pSer/pThr/pTyr-binding forkhead associated (FHA) protein/predicted MPP superfamily phosphohydrolase
MEHRRSRHRLRCSLGHIRASRVSQNPRGVAILMENMGDDRPGRQRLRTMGRLVLARDPSQPGIALPPHLLDGFITRIGRISGGSENRSGVSEFLIPDSTISREHAFIEIKSGGLVLRDAGSSNGTFVNGFRIDRFPIKAGDQIQFGGLNFVLRGRSPKETFVHIDQSPTDSILSNGEHNGESDWGIQHLSARSDGFGVIYVRGYNGLCEHMSGVGILRLETAIARIVAKHLDTKTHAIRTLEDNDLRIELIAGQQNNLEGVTQKLAREIAELVGKVSPAAPKVDWSTSALDPKVARRKALLKGLTPTPQLKNTLAAANASTELRWVHISDLHFGAGTVTWRHDHQQVMSSLVRDLQRNRFAAHRVFVTGDVAFSGAPEQYDAAFDALERLTDALDTTTSVVRIVPGNHDIDRKLAGTPLHSALHRHARASEVALDDMLVDPRTRAILLEKLAGFQQFIRKLAGHPAEIDWYERLTVNSANVAVWGLNSVWCSDSDDGTSAHGGFCPNLVMARGQYQERIREATLDDVHLLLTHHPLEWISDAHGRWLRSAFAAAPLVHLCGHIHLHASSTTMSLGRPNNLFTMVAGAAHSEQGEAVKHSYSRCVLSRKSDGQWWIGWNPRVYDPDSDEFRSDHGRLKLDAEGYAWLALPQNGNTLPVSRAQRSTATPPPLPKHLRKRPT